MARLLGDSPRVKLLEALVRLGPMEVSRADIAREAGLFRGSTNRAVSWLVKERFIVKVSAGARPKYRVNDASARLQLLAYLSAALETVDRRGLDGAEAARTIEGFRRAAQRTTRPISLDRIEGGQVVTVERTSESCSPQTQSETREVAA